MTGILEISAVLFRGNVVMIPTVCMVNKKKNGKAYCKVNRSWEKGNQLTPKRS